MILPSKSFGFTLIELLVVVGVIGVLATIVAVGINPATQLAKARDSQRKNDIAEIARALEAYYSMFGYYPYNTDNNWGGWDCSNIGLFIQPLIDAGELKNVPEDPKPNSEGSYCGYRYYRYSLGGTCTQPFYVLLAKMEIPSNGQNNLPACYGYTFNGYFSKSEFE